MLGEAGVDGGSLAQELGLDLAKIQDPGERLQSDPVIHLLNRTAVTFGDSIFGARIGRDYQPGRLGILDYLFLTSGNLDNALETVAKYNIVAADYGAYEYQKNSSDRRAAMIRTMPGEVDYTHAELFVVSWQLTMARHATGRDLRSARIELSQLASATHRDLLEALGVKSIEYGCPAATLSLSWDDLRLPLLGADPLLAAVLQRHADSRRPASPGWPAKVRAYLAAGLADRNMTLEVAARDLTVSPRSLQEYLHLAGTSWRAELASARDGLAIELLRSSSLPVSAIAYRVGFSDARSFRRAFRRQNGCSPDEYRRGVPLLD
ncbi:AraC family transcriptional regulator [Gordonia humi]|uniref:AraC-like DNA-binding protein n=2 Tax=Gordonia humi TaxID=686429 RepID=A0A840EYN1_9ACTN|nr:AraC family transcriptional regulator [Gordonia humi]MBB4138205.1 AraC-like DNA-binding protein [Gordonia humi]